MRALSERFHVVVYLLAVIVWGLWCQSNVRAAAQENISSSAVTKLPAGVEAVWDLEQAYRETTASRERICINGLWRWQPGETDQDSVPSERWGYFKVPGSWPGITDYMQKDCQTVFAHPSWQNQRLGGLKAAWYQREIQLPPQWEGRRIALQAEYVNSFAVVYVDNKRVGEIRFPAGEVELTGICAPGGTHVLSMLVVAMPLQAVMQSYNDSASARQVEGRVARRGLCGDVYLASTPAGPRIDDVKVVTSVRQSRIDIDLACQGLEEGKEYVLRAKILDGANPFQQFTSEPFRQASLQKGRIAFGQQWKPEKLWNVDTPENQYQLQVSLCEAGGQERDTDYVTRFGFREFWIDGRDFILNGTRIFLSSVPMDNAQIGAAWATYEAARESMKRLQSFGINFVYTHNYGCEPGSHLGFEEILRAADDVGMLVAFSQPHFSHYDWDSPAAATTNGYARHAAFFVHVAQNHPSVVAYATSHNATGYADDMNPDMMDGIRDKRSQWSVNNVRRAQQVETIIKTLDPSRIVYHHASGNLGSLHNSNFYTNFTPVQEMSDWFEHWATEGVKPLFTCEYSVPMPWDWTMYRGWYKGKREFGSAPAPWEFCVAEWNAQFFGDQAYKISEQEKANLRWEAKRFASGDVWRRWDYPNAVGSSKFRERYPVYAKYFADNWPAFRTWGVSANSPWNHGHYWVLRDGVNKDRQDLTVDWRKLQRPGFSPDFIEERYERVDLAFDMSDWMPTVAAQTLIRNNGPLLAYIAGKPEAFTSKDHNFLPGETFEKQLVVINNSRSSVTAACQWSLGLPTPLEGSHEVTVAAGQQRRIALQFELPRNLASGKYQISATSTFNNGVTQEDAFAIDVLAPPVDRQVRAKVALFDPNGETRSLLDGIGVRYGLVDATSELSEYDLLVVGKNALTPDGPAPQIERVRTGLKVLIFEQTPDVLEGRFGFRVATYGLRTVFSRVSDHPVLAGIDTEHWSNWRGEATIVPPRLDYWLSPEFNYTPTVRWCGIPVPRLWRCGNRGNVATALIEKPQRGDFLPILDGGYSLQYSPLLEYREGQGIVLFCQLDVTGRTERDPAALMLVRNTIDYIANWKPTPRRTVVYVGDARGRAHLESIGLTAVAYSLEKLTVDTVLVVGPGGGKQLAADAAVLSSWLTKGGHVLALGLDMRDANSFLPVKVEMQESEHIATYFEPFKVDSPFAGIGPSDVHNPAPRQLPLLSGSAAVGNGILGKAPSANILFCQFPPFLLADAGQQHNLKRTHRRTSFLLARLLANMGVAGTTPILQRFSSPVSGSSAASVAKNGDFSIDADGDAMADHWTFSPAAPAATCVREKNTSPTDGWSLRLSSPAVEGKKSSVMLAQHDVPIEKGQWYRIALRARGEDLAAKSVSIVITNMANWKSLFEYQRFEPEAEWQPFHFEVQANDSAADNTRLQIWFEGAGTLEMADVRVEPISDPTVGRWLEGLYLDTPEEWDDPYRFFRW